MRNRASREPPLRVVLLNSIVEWGGGEKWCLETARMLARRGHYVAVACVAGGALEKRAVETELPVWVASRRGWLLASAPRLARFLREQRIEALVGNVGRDMRMAALATARTRVKLLQRRGLLRRIKGDALSRWLYGRRIDRLIANAGVLRDLMLEGVDFVDPRRVVIIPNGIDTTRPAAGDGSRLRASLRIGAEVPVVGVVSRLTAMKGHVDLLAAWPGVRARVPDARLLIAGDGPLRRELEARALECGESGSIHFLGYRRDLDDLYQAIDVFALASRRDEGSSNALLEAMWHGRAAVVTACGGLAEVARDAETGRVVPVGAPAALGAALVELLRDSDLRVRMGDAARKRVESHYSLDRVTDLFEDVLFELRGEPQF